VHDSVRETLDRTVAHLQENKVDLTQTPLTLGALLRIHPEREGCIGQPRADALLSREYRRPFVVPGEAEV
jgi:hypothetical protein